ncbi:MAG TPA: NrfD/PsrC family molybdoenzyme membrane anchor subunit [Solirubrobacteraceae bacterium]|jgi:formate-dependent nitrite reductase membrane component NrfD|nr:NrfD/PsrC family molybdoenzyme membrane anchor subunit [Solirubrobacteraceae bacterium]
MSPRGGRRKRESVVQEAEFSSYYGRPIVKEPTWKPLDIASYLFLGGLAGASSSLAAGAQLSGRPGLARPLKLGAAGAISLSLVALVHDLGRPARFLNMLRVFKPTSPMSVGVWIVSAYAPAAGVAALEELVSLGRLRPLGKLGAVGAALLGPAVASYTGVLISNTATPAWHEGHREMPFVFVGSAASAAAGLGLLGAPLAENAPARRLAVIGTVAELTAVTLLRRRVGIVAETYRDGRAGMLMRAAEALALAGVAGAIGAGHRSRLVAGLSGAALLAASACARFGIFEAGRASARDPKYTVIPQRERKQAEQR